LKTNRINLVFCLFCSVGLILTVKKKSHLYFTLELPGKSKAYHLKVMPWLTPLVYSSRIALFLGCILFFLQFTAAAYLSLSHYVEKSKNQFIKNQISSHNEKLEKIEFRLDFMQNVHKELSLNFGNPEITLPTYGVGGPLNKDSLARYMADPNLLLKTRFRQMRERIELKMDFARNHFDDLQSNLEESLNQWRFVPSIKPSAGYYSSGYGYRLHPVTGQKNAFHAGLDIANTPNTHILAAADGIVSEATFESSYGNYVVIDHNNGYLTYYAHLNKIKVKKGQFVQRYDLIGLMGSTGRSTGTHLHYEVRVSNHPVNPIDYILPTDHIVD
jgi:murein DD-endopeptidase MepM/ murein hydrolase activator NlpD